MVKGRGSTTEAEAEAQRDARHRPRSWIQVGTHTAVSGMDAGLWTLEWVRSLKWQNKIYWRPDPRAGCGFVAVALLTLGNNPHSKGGIVGLLCPTPYVVVREYGASQWGT